MSTNRINRIIKRFCRWTEAVLSVVITIVIIISIFVMVVSLIKNPEAVERRQGIRPLPWRSPLFHSGHRDGQDAHDSQNGRRNGRSYSGYGPPHAGDSHIGWRDAPSDNRNMPAFPRALRNPEVFKHRKEGWMGRGLRWLQVRFYRRICKKSSIVICLFRKAFLSQGAQFNYFIATY